jgi:hypothetical protein
MVTSYMMRMIFKGILYREEEDKCNYENMEKISLTRQVKSKEESSTIKPIKCQAFTTRFSVITVIVKCSFFSNQKTWIGESD